MPFGLRRAALAFSRKSRASGVENITSSLPDEPGNESSHTDSFGLFRLESSNRSRQDCDTVNVGNQSVGLNEVDIIAIHGLGGTPYKTWTHENGVLWLRDVVP